MLISENEGPQREMQQICHGLLRMLMLICSVPRVKCAALRVSGHEADVVKLSFCNVPDRLVAMVCVREREPHVGLSS